jgi:hypothetical protein
VLRDDWQRDALPELGHTPTCSGVAQLGIQAVCVDEAAIGCNAHL